MEERSLKSVVVIPTYNEADNIGRIVPAVLERDPDISVLVVDEVIFEMDADFSHDPVALDEFLEEIKTHDVVLGSRYLYGVTVVNWPLRRVILSVAANIYARIVTGMSIKDSTGGFKCFRREVIEALPLPRIKSDGYSFQIEMNYHCWKRGYRIKEIPIMFVDRQVGVSKMSKKIIWEAMWMVWALRFRRIP